MANCGRKQDVKYKQLTNHDIVMVLEKSNSSRRPRHLAVIKRYFCRPSLTNILVGILHYEFRNCRLVKPSFNCKPFKLSRRVKFHETLR